MSKYKVRGVGKELVTFTDKLTTVLAEIHNHLWPA
jgi:hypothetical protein